MKHATRAAHRHVTVQVRETLEEVVGLAVLAAEDTPSHQLDIGVDGVEHLAPRGGRSAGRAASARDIATSPRCWAWQARMSGRPQEAAPRSLRVPPPSAGVSDRCRAPPAAVVPAPAAKHRSSAAESRRGLAVSGERRAGGLKSRLIARDVLPGPRSRAAFATAVLPMHSRRCYLK
eukprot:scaffold2703_cov129-Isochrysis_galbana.AAC.7